MPIIITSCNIGTTHWRHCSYNSTISGDWGFPEIVKHDPERKAGGSIDVPQKDTMLTQSRNSNLFSGRPHRVNAFQFS